MLKILDEEKVYILSKKYCVRLRSSDNVLFSVVIHLHISLFARLMSVCIARSIEKP